MAAAAMRPGPPVQPSRRRPPRRQHPHQQQLYRERNQQQQQQQERRRSRLLPRPRGHDSRTLLVLLLLASNPLVLTQAEPPESSAALAAPTTQCQQVSTTHSNLWSASNDKAIQPRNLTIGYLTAIKGGLKDRQGLAISGALTMALDEVRSKVFYTFFSRRSTVLKKKCKIDWRQEERIWLQICNWYTRIK